MLKKRSVPDAQLQSQIEKVTSPWFRFFVRHDPAPTLRAIDVPVLALYGRKDLQVPPDQNADPMRTALDESLSDDVDSATDHDGLTADGGQRTAVLYTAVGRPAKKFALLRAASYFV